MKIRKFWRFLKERIILLVTIILILELFNSIKNHKQNKASSEKEDDIYKERSIDKFAKSFESNVINGGMSLSLAKLPIDDEPP